MSSDTPWQSPSGPDDAGPSPAEPRFGAYGTPAAGQPAVPPGAGPYPAYPGPMPPSGPGFFVAPKPGIIPLRPLSITEIIGGAFEALRANPKAMFVPALIVMSVIGLLSAVQTYLSTTGFYSLVGSTPNDATLTSDQVFGLALESLGSVGSAAVTAALTSVASTILTGLLIVAVSRSVLGRIARPGEVWERTKGRVWALIGQSILTSLIAGSSAILVILGFLLVGAALIPSFRSGEGPGASFAVALSVLFLLGIASAVLAAFLGVRLSLSSAALILENVGVFEGIKRSWKLTRGYFWHVLGTMLLALIITTVATSVLSGIAGMFGGLAAAFSSPSAMAVIAAISSFISSVVSAAILPFTAAVTALIYIDLRMRQEGLDVELRQSAGL